MSERKKRWWKWAVMEQKRSFFRKKNNYLTYFFLGPPERFDVLLCWKWHPLSFVSFFSFLSRVTLACVCGKEKKYEKKLAVSSRIPPCNQSQKKRNKALLLFNLAKDILFTRVWMMFDSAFSLFSSLSLSLFLSLSFALIQSKNPPSSTTISLQGSLCRSVCGFGLHKSVLTVSFLPSPHKTIFSPSYFSPCFIVPGPRKKWACAYSFWQKRSKKLRGKLCWSPILCNH